MGEMARWDRSVQFSLDGFSDSQVNEINFLDF